MSVAQSPFVSAKKMRNMRDEKRAEIMISAVRLFNVNGITATSISDISAVIGISKPTIYHYFGSKDNLLRECVIFGLEQLRTALDSALGLRGSAANRLRQFLLDYARIAMSDFGRCVSRTPMEALDADSARDVRLIKREVDIGMRKIIEDGVNDGSISTDNPKMLTFALAGSLNGLARWYNPDGPRIPEDIAREMVAILEPAWSKR